MRKTTSLLLLVAALFSSVLLTSCMDDSEANKIPQLNAVQKAKWMEYCAGSYFGSFTIVDDNRKEQVRPFDFTITAADSTLHCQKFPLDILALFMSSDQNALLNAPQMEFKAELHPFYGGYESDYSYYIFPTQTKMNYQFADGDKDYKVTINFATYIIYSSGAGPQQYIYPLALRNHLSDILQANVLIESVEVNGTKHSMNKVAVVTGYPDSRYKREDVKL